MPFDHYHAIAKAGEARTRAELVHAFNNTAADRVTGRNDVPQTGGKIETAETKRKKAARRFLRDLQDIIRAGEMGERVANTVFGAKSDVEIATIVSELEVETGMTLTEYAAGFIGADALERRSGENESDYNRRIIIAVAAQITDPRTGRIKQEYEDDPLAEIITNDAAYQSIMAKVDIINQYGASPEADRVVADQKRAGYQFAEAAAGRVDDDGYKRELREGQKVHRDNNADAAPALAESASFFGTGLTR